MTIRKIDEKMIDPDLIKKVSDQGAQLAETSTELEKKMTVGSTWAYQQIPQVKLIPPSGFTWQNAPVNIYKNGIGKISTDIDVSSYEITGKTYYVDIVNGLGSNDGLTTGTALPNIQSALDKTDCIEVIVATGTYYNGLGFNGTGLVTNRACSIKAVTGAKVVFSNSRTGLSYTLASAKVNTYYATRTNIGRVFDKKYIDTKGDYLELTKVTSADLVESTPNSFWDNGTYLFVHTTDNRIPDNDITPYFNNINCLQTAFNIYVEGIEFHGGMAAFKGTSGANVYAKNCKFKYSTTDDGFTVNSSLAILQGCEASKNFMDGFNYNAGKVIEVSCIGRDNGVASQDDTQNGSTQHNGGKIIRVNGVYYRNKGSNVGDNHVNTQSWNIGCVSYESVAVTENRYKSNFTAHTDAEMWNESCVSYGSLNANTVQNNAKMHLKDVAFIGNTTLEGTGEVIYY